MGIAVASKSTPVNVHDHRWLRKSIGIPVTWSRRPRDHESSLNAEPPDLNPARLAGLAAERREVDRLMTRQIIHVEPGRRAFDQKSLGLSV